MRPLALLALLLACTEPGVVGETNACSPSCDEALLCDMERARCVECLSARDCEDGELCSGGRCAARGGDEDPPDSGASDEGEGDGDDEEEDAPREGDGDGDEAPSDGDGDDGSGGDEGDGEPES